MERSARVKTIYTNYLIPYWSYWNRLFRDVVTPFYVNSWRCGGIYEHAQVGGVQVSWHYPASPLLQRLDTVIRVKQFNSFPCCIKSYLFFLCFSFSLSFLSWEYLIYLWFCIALLSNTLIHLLSRVNTEVWYVITLCSHLMCVSDLKCPGIVSCFP